MFKRKTLHKAKVENIDKVMMEWIYHRRNEGMLPAVTLEYGYIDLRLTVV